MASWRKQIVARLPPLGARVRVSVDPYGFRGGRKEVWVGFSRGFYVSSIFHYHKFHSSGPGRSSGKALGYGLDDPGSISGVGEVEIFFTPSCPDWCWDSLSLLKISTGSVSRGQRRPSVGLATLPLTSAVAVYTWTLESTSPLGLHCL